MVQKVWPPPISVWRLQRGIRYNRRSPAIIATNEKGTMMRRVKSAFKRPSFNQVFVISNCHYGTRFFKAVFGARILQQRYIILFRTFIALYLTRAIEVRIVMIGLDGAGKTTILYDPTGPNTCYYTG